MAKKTRHVVRGECPQCACGDVSFIPSETIREKYIGSEEEMEIMCPTCGTKHKGKLDVEEVES
jgi:hypothetical protein